MPAGTSFLIEEGMLGHELHNATIQGEAPADYFYFEIRNQFLHAVHPLGWMRRLMLCVDGEEIRRDRYFFVLRGQWVRADHLPDITDIYWHLCEPARIYVRKDGGIGAGRHEVRLTITASRLEDTVILDRQGRWPLREQTVAREMLLKEG